MACQEIVSLKNLVLKILLKDLESKSRFANKYNSQSLCAFFSHLKSLWQKLNRAENPLSDKSSAVCKTKKSIFCTILTH